MSEMKKLIKYAKSYNFDEFIKIFENMIKEQEPILLLKRINKEVNFIDQRPNSKTISKNSFLEKLDDFLKEKSIDTNFFKTIQVIESMYAEILKERERILQAFPNTDVSSEDIIALLIISSYIGYNDIQRAIELEVNGDFDTYINDLSIIVTNNLKLECYANEWFNGNDISIFPDSVFNSINNLNKEYLNQYLAPLLVNTGLWDIVQEFDYYFRLLEVDIVFNGNDISLLDNDKMRFFEYAMIAEYRMTNAKISDMIKVLPILNTFDNLDIDTIEFNRILESCIFSLFYHIDINSNDIYDGLTLKEWIDVFYLLNKMAKVFYDETKAFILYDREELLALFREILNDDEKCNIAIDKLSFKKDSPDIFDTPLLKFSNNQYMLLPIGVIAPNMMNIMKSILSRGKVSLKNKGELFEKNVFNFFKELEGKFNLKCTQPKRIINKEEYQFDVLIEWESFIFIIECKNRSIPDTTPISLSNFIDKSTEYVEQIKRLESGLKEYSSQFSINIEGKEIVPIILNSLSFSLDFKINEVIFTDFSVITKFFESRYLTKKIYEKSSLVIQEELYDQWQSDKPNAQIFLNYISKPYQVTEALDKIKYVITEHNVLNYKLQVKRRSIPNSVELIKKLESD